MKPLRELVWNCEFIKTITNIGGQKLDMYYLTYDNDSYEGVTLAVPHGRKDLAEFVGRSVQAGARVVQELREGEEFRP